MGLAGWGRGGVWGLFWIKCWNFCHLFDYKFSHGISESAVYYFVNKDLKAPESWWIFLDGEPGRRYLRKNDITVNVDFSI